MDNFLEVDFQKLLTDPSAYYERPADIIRDSRLTKAEKIALLKVWAFDANEIEVAQEENMIGPPSRLREVLLVLRDINVPKR